MFEINFTIDGLLTIYIYIVKYTVQKYIKIFRRYLREYEAGDIQRKRDGK